MAAWEVFTFAQLIPCLGLRVMVEKEAAACLLFSCFCLLGEALYHRIASHRNSPFHTTLLLPTLAFLSLVLTVFCLFSISW